MIADVFCKIINKELAADVVMEDKDWLAVKDIHPQAPAHILILPKKHISELMAAQEEDEKLLGKLLLAAKKVAEKLGLGEKGFRIIINQGEHGGQLVPHLHMHLLGGKSLGPKVVHDDKEAKSEK